jgi:hypothetical protein
MNHHCDKLVYASDAQNGSTDPAFDGLMVAEFHSCPNCGSGAAKRQE